MTNGDTIIFKKEDRGFIFHGDNDQGIAAWSVRVALLKEKIGADIDWRISIGDDTSVVTFGGYEWSELAPVGAASKLRDLSSAFKAIQKFLDEGVESIESYCLTNNIPFLNEGRPE